jgi:hypothetical protein
MTVLLRLTSVARLFDLRLASNRFVLAAVAVATLSAFALDRAGVAAGLTVFLAWALARELDPDHAAAATIAALVGFGLFLIGDPVHLWAMATLLLAVRLMAGTTGAPPTWFDLIWLPALGALSAPTFDGFLCGLALAVAIASSDGGRRALRALSAVATAVGAAIVALITGALMVRPALPSHLEWLVFAACVLAVPALHLPPPVSVGDRSGVTLSAARLVRARLLAVATGTLAILGLGGDAVSALTGLWAALLGIAATTYGGRAMRRWRVKPSSLR